MSYRIAKTALVLFTGISGLVFSAPANAAEYTVEINKTQIMRLPTAAASIIIGNPQIADISVHSSDTLLVNGRGYGETNIIVFDQFGQTVLDANIQVKAPALDSGIRVNFIGEGKKSYTCTPFCAPSPIHGDAPAFIGEFTGQATANTNATATGPLSPQPQTQPQPDQNNYNQQR
jgi:hypothetical protein